MEALQSTGRIYSDMRDGNVVLWSQNGSWMYSVVDSAGLALKTGSGKTKWMQKEINKWVSDPLSEFFDQSVVSIADGCRQAAEQFRDDTGSLFPNSNAFYTLVGRIIQEGQRNECTRSFSDAPWRKPKDALNQHKDAPMEAPQDCEVQPWRKWRDRGVRRGKEKNRPKWQTNRPQWQSLLSILLRRNHLPKFQLQRHLPKLQHHRYQVQKTPPKAPAPQTPAPKTPPKCPAPKTPPKAPAAQTPAPKLRAARILQAKPKNFPRVQCESLQAHSHPRVQLHQPPYPPPPEEPDWGCPEDDKELVELKKERWEEVMSLLWIPEIAAERAQMPWAKQELPPSKRQKKQPMPRASLVVVTMYLHSVYVATQLAEKTLFLKV